MSSSFCNISVAFHLRDLGSLLIVRFRLANYFLRHERISDTFGKQFFLSTKFYVFLWCDIVMKEIIEMKVKVKVRSLKLSKKDNGRVERKQEDFVRCGKIVYLQKTKRWQLTREQFNRRLNLGRIIYMYRRTNRKSNSATWRTALTSAQYENYSV